MVLSREYSQEEIKGLFHCNCSAKGRKASLFLHFADIFNVILYFSFSAWILTFLRVGVIPQCSDLVLTVCNTQHILIA